jgi:DNA polymerase III subunit gamma/tau
MAGDAPIPEPGSPGSPLALYRRYRPGSFAEVKGQDHVTEPLRQALLSGRVHHAYLFSGPRGCGKTSSARILARSLNCEFGPTPDPCGTCASCIALAPAGPGSIDVIEIDAASHGGVDDARDLRERAFYAPVSGRYKIYIIDEAHMVTREGFNALLKLVEEPPPHLKFVFATTEPEKVIATIRSRTHHYPFRLVPPAVLREHLEQILASEAVPYEPAVLPVVIRAGAGSVRDAMSVLDQLIAGSDPSGLRYDRAIALLGYTDDRLLDEVIEAFIAEDGAAVFHAIDHVVEAGHDPRRFAADLLDRLRDLIVLSAVPDASVSGLIDAPSDRLEQMGKQAAASGLPQLTRAAEIISAGLVEMRGATSPRLLLELMCAQVLLPAGADTTVLADRLDRLERRLTAPTAAEPVRRPEAAPASRTAPAQLSRTPAAASRGDSGGRPPAVQPPREDSGRRPAGAQQREDAPEQPPGVQQQADAADQAPGVQQRRREQLPDQAGLGSARSDTTVTDAESLRARWPDVLEAVQSRKRVASMQLTNATVASFEDGVLTLAFEKPGTLKGFLVAENDKVLAGVLADMFGVRARISTSVASSYVRGADGVPESTDSSAGGERSAAPQSGAGGARRQAGPAAGRTGGQSVGGGQPRRSAQAGGSGSGSEPGHGDHLDADELTGTDLIARELGGRIIEELGEP